MDDPSQTTLDDFLGGAVSLRQPKAGHRAGTDAMLLAAAAPDAAMHLVDLGAGVGAVGIAAAIRLPEARLTLVEIDAGLAALARENLASNGLAGRSSVVETDILGPAATREVAGLTPRMADLVLTNPPFDAEGQGRASPDAARRRAHLMPPGGLDVWLRAAAHLIKPGGTLIMIHRADALRQVLSAVEGRFGGVRLIFVHPSVGEPAHRLLIRATLGSKAHLAVLPPLVLHDDEKRFTPIAEALHRGAARLDWDKGGLEHP